MDRKRTGLGARIAPYTTARQTGAAPEIAASGDKTANEAAAFVDAEELHGPHIRSGSAGADPESPPDPSADTPPATDDNFSSLSIHAPVADQGSRSSNARTRSVNVKPATRSARMGSFGRARSGKTINLIWVGVGSCAALILIAVGAAALVAGSTEAVGPGPAAVQAGAPVGFAHTEEGAREAALQYISLTGTPLMNDSEAYRAAAKVIASPDAQEEWTTGAERALQAFDRARKALGVGPDEQVAFKLYPLTDSVASYDGKSSVVRVWAMSLLTADGVKARTSFVTYTVTLDWFEGDWKGSKLSVSTAADPREAQGLPDELTDFEHVVDGTTSG